MLKQVSNSFAANWFYDQALSLPIFVSSFDRKNNRPSGMICGWNTPCSGEPFRLAIALWKKGYTHKIVIDSKEFVVSIPNESLRKEMDFFCKTHGDKVSKFETTKIKTLKSKYIKTPLIADATANFECRVINQIDCGDHFLFIGEVLDSYINKGNKIMVNLGKKDSNRLYQEI